jgi:hypothetical protein
MTIILITLAYIVAAIFYIRISWRLYLLSGLSGDRAPGRGISIPLFFNALFDIVFLRRLFKLNPLLWVGEWMFHLAFIATFLGHLRYIFLKPPWFTVYLLTFSEISVHLLIGSLVYIFVYRIIFMIRVKEGFTSKYNLFLVITIMFISVSGYLLRFVYRTDIIQVKEFVLGVLSFSPMSAPDSLLFAAHFSLAMIFISAVPTHIFTAPLVGLDTHRRDAGIGALLHGKK